MSSPSDAPPEPPPGEEPSTPGVGLPKGKGRVARNLLFNLLGLGLATPLNLAGMLILARRLGKEEVGLYFSVFAIAIVVFILAGAGIPIIVTRRIAQSEHRLQEHVSQAIGLLLLVSVVSVMGMVLAGVGWSFAKDEPVQWKIFFVAGLAAAGRQAMEVCIGAFRGLERFEFESLMRICQSAVFCTLVVATVFPSTGSLAAVYAFAGGHFAAAVLGFGILFTRFGCLGFRLNGKIVKDWLSESLPVGWGDAIRLIALQIDTLLLSLFRTNAVVGLYNVAYRPLMPLRIVPRTLASVTFPMMSRMAQNNPARLSRAFGRSVLFLFVLSLPICIGVTLGARQIILLLAGPDFVEATLPLQLLIWITMFLFLTAQFRFLFTAMGQQRVYTRLVFGVLVVKVLLHVVLIPFFGLYGACAGSLIGEGLLAIVGFVVCARLGVKQLPWFRMVRALPAAAVMAWMMWLVSDAAWPLLAVVGLAAAVMYCIACILCGVFERGDLEQLLQIMNRFKRRLTGGSAPSPLKEPHTV